ncbi:hypothetical protein OHA72_40655 [Dactylosporangium sp. NBC_01737]|nr:hypothetical protein OHA72_40655 [Dactylosporangium sp. NBC_01737]
MAYTRGVENRLRSGRRQGPGGALRDDQLRLLQDGRGYPGRLVQQGRDQRHPAGPADQEQPGEGPVGFGGGEHGAGQRDGAVHDGAGEALQLFPAERRVLLDERQVDVRRRGPGQDLLRGAHVLPQVAVGAAVGDGLRVGELPHGLAVGGGVHLAEVVDDRGVDVEAAGVVEAFAGDDVPAGGGAGDDGRVERAGAEVVHDDAAADGHRGAGRGDEERGRGDGLGNQLRGAETGLAGRFEQDGPAAGTPRGRVGEHDGAGFAAHGPHGLGPDPGQDGGDERIHAVLDVAEQDGAVVDAALRVRLVPLRPDPGGVGRLAADEQALTVQGHADARRQ